MGALLGVPAFGGVKAVTALTLALGQTLVGADTVE